MEALRRVVSEEGGDGCTVWASFDWTRGMDLEEQEALIQCAGVLQAVVMMGVLKREVDSWPPATQRRARSRRSGTIWILEAGREMSRLVPLPET